MKKLVISASAKLQEDIQKWKIYFENQGYNVINYPKNIDQNDIKQYQDVYIEFFKSLDETDILFVLNETKNGIDGYIGAQTFAELSYTMVQNTIHNKNKKIWILNIPSEEVKSYEEINNFIKLGWITLFNRNI